MSERMQQHAVDCCKHAFEQKRIEFAKVLTEKYGDGNINLENGEISPTS
jgi:hypothetical protein